MIRTIQNINDKQNEIIAIIISDQHPHTKLMMEKYCSLTLTQSDEHVRNEKENKIQYLYNRNRLRLPNDWFTQYSSSMKKKMSDKRFVDLHSTQSIPHKMLLQQLPNHSPLNHTKTRQQKYIHMIAAQSTLVSAWMSVHVNEKSTEPNTHKHIVTSTSVRLTCRQLHSAHNQIKKTIIWPIGV